ncbi:MAG: AMP-binding protein [Clostridia bacterium]|nr:AMP-binding protein [Clostridia bacterium]
MKNKLYNPVEFKNLREVINNSVKLYENNNAFIIKEKNGSEVSYKNITYKEFKKDIDSLGTALLNMGLKGKRVAVISKNRYEWAVSYLAVLNGVGIVIPLDKSLPPQEIKSLLERSKADAVIFESKYIEVMQEIKAENTKLTKFICMDETEEDFISYKKIVKTGRTSLEGGNDEYLNSEIKEEEMSIILFTSGTTSLSKAVMLSHRNIASNIYALNTVVKIYNTDVNLAFLPFHHTFGSTGLLFFLSNGAANAFCDGLKYIAQNLAEYKISVFVSVPLLLEAMYKKIMKQVEKQGKTKTVEMGVKLTKALRKVGVDVRRKVFKEIIDNLGGSLRLVVTGAAAIDRKVAEGFNDFGITTIQGYGLTETAPVLSAENDKFIEYGSVGFPMINVEIEIDNPNEEGIGELKAKGPNVMLGYYENEEATNEVLKDGWFYTGDLAYKDKKGAIHITGRKKNVVVLKNGKNIYPEEIELLINNLIYVKESMVFGLPKDDDLLLSAKIVFDEDYIKANWEDTSEEGIKEKIWQDIKEINKDMVTYKHIKHIIVTNEEMIKTTTAKIKRFEEIKKICEEN